jgi:hypothetical protein
MKWCLLDPDESLVPKLESDSNLAVAWRSESGFNGMERAKGFAPWLLGPDK